MVELVRLPASELLRNPRNWRQHPREQREAMEGIFAEVGVAGAALARRLADGRIELIDGELRADVAADEPIPVLILDVTEAEALKLLAVHDPIGAMAEANEPALRELLEELDTDQAGLRDLLVELSGYESESDEVLGELGESPVPEMDLQPYEHYDYVLFLFRNKLDFESACEQLALSTVQASAMAGKRKIGLGRCLAGDRLLALLNVQQRRGKR